MKKKKNLKDILKEDGLNPDEVDPGDEDDSPELDLGSISQYDQLKAYQSRIETLESQLEAHTDMLAALKDLNSELRQENDYLNRFVKRIRPTDPKSESTHLRMLRSAASTFFEKKESPKIVYAMLVIYGTYENPSQRSPYQHIRSAVAASTYTLNECIDMVENYIASRPSPVSDRFKFLINVLK